MSLILSVLTSVGLLFHVFATGFVAQTVAFDFKINPNTSSENLLVDYGDGSSQVISSNCAVNDTTVCISGDSITHTYTSPGTYLVKLETSDCNEELLNTETVVVQ
jgi:hypothetical protein